MTMAKTRSLGAINKRAAAKRTRGQAKQPPSKTAIKLAPSRKSRVSAKRGGDTHVHGMPESSSAWLHPQSSIPSTSASQFNEEQKSSVRAKYHQRLLAIAGDTAPEHSFLLSVDTSKIPNAGRGLFLKYLGPEKVWTVPGYVDLGCYGPHRASDIKRDFAMEVKNFVFQDRPGEWSFACSGLDKSESMKPLTLFDKNIVQDIIFDITDDATGEVHQLAEETLLPFVNEVTVQSDKGRGKNAKLQQVQNIDAVHHDDGSLHYLLRAASTFRRGEESELLVYYGKQYEGNRHRKPDAYGGKTQKKNAKKDAAENAGGTLRHSAILTVDDNEDMSTLSNSDEHASVLTCSHNVVTHVCNNCMERTTVSAKTPVSTSCFTDMRKSIFTYTESDVVAVLDLFLENPPTDSVARHRMRWILDQICPYLKQMLFPRKGLMPPEMRDKLQSALELFPRGRDSPYHEEDCRVMEAFQYLGVAIRKERGTCGFKTGIVEQQIVESERPGEGDNGLAEKHYLVVYFSGEGEEILPESEVQSSYIPNRFGMMG